MAIDEAIAYLRGKPVPGVEGLTFDEDFKEDGDIVDIEVIRDADGVSVGTARGERADELIQQAQGFAREAEAD